MAISISPYVKTSWINNSAPNIQADLLNNIENNLFNVIELSNSLCNEINSIQNNRLSKDIYILIKRRNRSLRCRK